MLAIQNGRLYVLVIQNVSTFSVAKLLPSLEEFLNCWKSLLDWIIDHYCLILM